MACGFPNHTLPSTSRHITTHWHIQHSTLPHALLPTYFPMKWNEPVQHVFQNRRNEETNGMRNWCRLPLAHFLFAYRARQVYCKYFSSISYNNIAFPSLISFRDGVRMAKAPQKKLTTELVFFFLLFVLHICMLIWLYRVDKKTSIHGWIDATLRWLDCVLKRIKKEKKDMYGKGTYS